MFRRSRSYAELVGWIEAVGRSVSGMPNSAAVEVPPVSAHVLELLEWLDGIVDAVPPTSASRRFGDTAYREFYDRAAGGVVERLAGWSVWAAESSEIAGAGGKEAIVGELSDYLMDSLGNRQRIDYGTGHELHFAVFVMCLCRLGLIRPPHFAHIATRLLPRYLALVRRLQVRYGMEPAGSRGVWCLDDHQFIPFIWGGHQLVGHARITPNDVLDADVVAANAADYLYLCCIDHILRVKTGPFFEHSPDLYNISGAASWAKIAKGMLLKYKDDLLSKWPVMQHFLFGRLFPFQI